MRLCLIVVFSFFLIPSPLSAKATYTYDREAAQKKPSEKFKKALAHAKKEIKQLHLYRDDLKHLIEYIEFYTSWYQAVTPAPRDLYDSLSDEAHEFVEELKTIAKVFERKPKPFLMGATRLNPEGKIFYQRVLKSLRKKL